MAHPETWARRLLGQLPADPEELLELRSYWDPAFLGLYLERLNDQISERPHEAVRWAEVAPRLALLVPEDEGPEGRRAHREALFRALGLLGSAYRATGQSDAADEQYATALRIAGCEAISPEARTDLALRLSRLRAGQGRLEEALRLATEALESCPSQPCLVRSRALLGRGCALVELGQFSEAVDCFGEALLGIDPEESAAAARTYHAAVYNLDCVIPRTDRDDAWNIRRRLREARKWRDAYRRSIGPWVA